MKKSVITFLIVLSSLFCFGQYICLPEKVVDKIIAEGIVKDHLQYTVNLQDSTIRAYQRIDLNRREEIITYKLKGSEYNIIIKALREEIAIKTEENKSLRKQLRKIRFKSIGIIVIETGAIIILTIHLLTH